MTTKTISSGVTSSGLTVSRGETLLVEAGGAISQTIVAKGGVVSVAASGLTPVSPAEEHEGPPRTSREAPNRRLRRRC